MKTEKYSDQQAQIPQEGKHIVAQCDGDSIIVYQAFNDAIADYALAHQKFGGPAYSQGRMTWIKPNFMWMMYRSGWGTKVNQTRTLAIRLKKEGFDELLAQAVHSSFQAHLHETREDWSRDLKTSNVRLQWDPDHSPTGAKLARRAVQIGIRGEAFQKFNREWISEIIDLSDFVSAQREHIRSADLVVPFERRVDYSGLPEIALRVGLWVEG